MEVVLIAAVAANGVIGRDGSLPWHLPEDLAHFKETTMGHPVIMGRVAFEDILDHLGEPLPGRTNIVMSRTLNTDDEDVILVRGMDDALAAARNTGAAAAYVAGGATIYEQYLPIADRMVLSELHEAYDGDVNFPEFDESVWQEQHCDSRDDFDIVEYQRATRD